MFVFQIHVPLTPIAKRMVEAIKGPRGGANFAPGMHPGGRGGAMGGSFGGRPRGRGGMGGMNAYQMGGMGRQDGFRGRGGGFGGMGRGGRGFGMGGGRGGGGMFNPMERAGSFTRARLMNRGGSIFGDRGGAALQGGAYNPYGLQRGSGVYKVSENSLHFFRNQFFNVVFGNLFGAKVSYGKLNFHVFWK